MPCALSQLITTRSPDLTLRHIGTALEHVPDTFVAEAMRQPFILALDAARFHHLGAAGAGKGDLDQHLAGLNAGISMLAELERLPVSTRMAAAVFMSSASTSVQRAAVTFPATMPRRGRAARGHRILLRRIA